MANIRHPGEGCIEQKTDGHEKAPVSKGRPGLFLLTKARFRR
jgi:hypothetical protein